MSQIKNCFKCSVHKGKDFTPNTVFLNVYSHYTTLYGPPIAAVHNPFYTKIPFLGMTTCREPPKTQSWN